MLGRAPINKDMLPVSDPLSIPAPLAEKSVMLIAPKRIGWGFLQLPGVRLPFSDTYRKGLFVFLLVTAVACFWEPLTDLYSLTKQQEHYSHIILIPWLSVYAFYMDRSKILSSKEWSPILGLCLMSAAAVVAWRIDHSTLGADTLSAQILAFVVACWGAFLLCFGASASRTFFFGLLFLLWMIPLPTALLSAVIVFLQRASAEATDVVFTLLGIPFYRDGFIFTLPNLSIHIAEECSGIRSTLSLIITSLVAGHFFLRSAWTKVTLVLIVIPLAIVKNAFRIVALSLLANYIDRTFITDSVLHRSGGIPLFVLSLVVLGLLTLLLKGLEKRSGSSDALPARV